MKQREFIKGVGSAAVAWPPTVQAQQSNLRRIGVLAAYLKAERERWGAAICESDLAAN